MPTKQNITLSLDKQLLKRARAFAAQRGTSISAMLAEELQDLVASETLYEESKAKALAQLNSPFRLEGAKIESWEALHDRQSLR
jgi:post-segregation antitoxin (ccd killing protein)